MAKIKNTETSTFPCFFIRTQNVIWNKAAGKCTYGNTDIYRYVKGICYLSGGHDKLRKIPQAVCVPDSRASNLRTQRLLQASDKFICLVGSASGVQFLIGSAKRKKHTHQLGVCASLVEPTGIEPVSKDLLI